MGNEKHINRRAIDRPEHIWRLSGSRTNVLEMNDASLDFQFAMFLDKSQIDLHIKIQSQ